MEFKVEKKSVRVVIGDKNYDMSVPSVMQHVNHRKAVAAAKPEESIEIMADYLASMGLPKEVVDSLDHDTFLDLYSFIHSSKKNSQATT